MKVLAVCDDPGCSTGFGTVAMEILSRWRGVDIEIWSTSEDPHSRARPSWPGYLVPRPWCEPPGLESLLQRLSVGGYTHLWMLNDLSGFSRFGFPERLRVICAEKGIRSLLYFPVDSAVEPASTQILHAVDIAVTYTAFGAREILAAGCDREVRVVPHGVATTRFSPGTTKRRDVSRKLIGADGSYASPGGKPFAASDDFLILCVSTNDWRKDLFRTLELLPRLHGAGMPAKLVLRTPPQSQRNGVDLAAAAHQLGLIQGLDWVNLPQLSDPEMESLYPAADLYLTTTLGEGWGLGITEALASGLAVALPRHTACAEIGEHVEAAGMAGRIAWLPLEAGAVFGYDTRLRRRVDLLGATAELARFYGAGTWRRQVPLAPEVREWLDWKRIAEQMLALLRGGEPER